MKIVMVLAMIAAAPAFADPAQTYAAACAKCHGSAATGAKGPALAGKDADDLAQALAAFTDRAHRGLSATTIDALSQWLSDL